MVKKIKKVAKALKKASALHKRQSKVIEKHIKEQENIQERNMVGDFIQTKTLVTLLESSSQRQQMREKQYRKLKRLISRLLGKFKF